MVILSDAHIDNRGEMAQHNRCLQSALMTCVKPRTERWEDTANPHKLFSDLLSLPSDSTHVFKENHIPHLHGHKQTVDPLIEIKDNLVCLG